MYTVLTSYKGKRITLICVNNSSYDVIVIDVLPDVLKAKIRGGEGVIFIDINKIVSFQP